MAAENEGEGNEGDDLEEGLILSGGRRGKTKIALRSHDYPGGFCCSIKQLLSRLVRGVECLFAGDEGTRLGG